MVRILQANSVDDASCEANKLLSYVLRVPTPLIPPLTRGELKGGVSPLITERQSKKLFILLKRRIKREPLQYILKSVEFYGLNFYIKRGVFIPRPETEILVEETIKLIKSTYIRAEEQKLLQTKNYKLQTIKIAEIGCGSGCIAITLTKNIDNCEIFATDISSLSLSCAKRNAKEHQVEKKIKFRKGKYLSPFKNLKNEMDIIIFNPPYIPTSDIPLLQKEVLQEPREAIDGGEKGLDFYKNVVSYIPYYIKNNGFIITEIGINQKESVCKIFQNSGFNLHKAILDYCGQERVLIFQAINLKKCKI